MSNLQTRLGRVASLVLAAIAVTSHIAAAYTPTKLDCDHLVPWFQSNNYGWWWGALGNCKTGPGGPTTFDDIFRCAYDQIDPSYRLDCVEKDLRSAPNTATGVDVVAYYNGGRTCTGLAADYERSNFEYWRKLILTAQIGAPAGLINTTDIFDFAWEQLPTQDRRDCLKELLQVAPVTAPTIQQVADYNTPGTCSPLIDSYKVNNYAAWWNALGKLKTGRGGLSTRAAIIDAAFRSLPLRDQQPCLLQYLSGTAITDLGVLEVRTYNGIPMAVRDDIAFEPQMPEESCDLPLDGTVPADYLSPSIPYLFLAGGMLPEAGDFNKPAGQHLGSDEGRLAPELRLIARAADPIGCALPLAAHTFADAAAAPTQGDANRLNALAMAYTDLAVTGSHAFDAFRTRNPTDEDYCTAIETRRSPSDCLPFSPHDPEDVEEGCRSALKRAYRVANFLRNGEALRVAGSWFQGDAVLTPLVAADRLRKETERLTLGWIAVSGEDDSPHRPVNVPSSDYPQYTIKVDVDAPYQNIGVEIPRFGPVPVTARYTIAQSQAPAAAALTYDPETTPYYLDPDPVPSIAKNSDVLLFIHGMDSRAEEATTITKHLFARMGELGSTRNLVVIAVDLPSSGYTESLDYDRISKLSVIGSPFDNTDFAATGLTPMLDFLETFVVRFVETLPPSLGVPDSMKAVMGGSLGGNLSFRLGRRANTPWIKNVVVWSPASIWTSLGEGNDVFQHAGVRSTWVSANDRNAADPNDLFGARLTRRRNFFDTSFDQSILGPIIAMSQPQVWTSDKFPCKLASIATARLDRQETYNPKFLSWRWRLAGEQLLYSHQTYELETGQRRFMRNDKPMFLSCGTEDDVFGNEICDATRLTGGAMSLTPGFARYLPDTGHSIHDERPRYLAQKMINFLGL